MERLTERTLGGVAYIPFRKNEGHWIIEQRFSETNISGDAADKLAEYEDLEESGRLVKLPCKEIYSKSGDNVYLIYDHEIIECIHCGAVIDADGKIVIHLAADEHIFPYRSPDPEHDLDPTDWCTDGIDVTADEFGKTVFLTHEAAEAKLKEMEGKG